MATSLCAKLAADFRSFTLTRVQFWEKYSSQKQQLVWARVGRQTDEEHPRRLSGQLALRNAWFSRGRLARPSPSGWKGGSQPKQEERQGFPLLDDTRLARRCKNGGIRFRDWRSSEPFGRMRRRPQWLAKAKRSGRAFLSWTIPTLPKAPKTEVSDVEPGVPLRRSARRGGDRNGKPSSSPPAPRPGRCCRRVLPDRLRFTPCAAIPRRKQRELEQ
jgi:hypothetical protein